MLAAQASRQAIDLAVVKSITLAAVTWPERTSPVWDRADRLQLVAYDDLRYAAELAAEQVLKQLRFHLAPHAKSIDEVVLAGELTYRHLALIANVQPDLVVVTVTSGRQRTVPLPWRR